jgi:membrane-associated protein
MLELLDFFLHLDKYLALMIQNYGTLVYLILFLIIFVETGVIVMPFLPGDSLLFAVGMFAGTGELDIFLVIGLLIIAAILGDTLNYGIGRWIGKAVFEREYKWLKREYLEKTQAFYEKHGGRTIILARFIPIVRTFAPFVAGVGKMSYTKFLTYNVVGGIVWVVLFVGLGYFLGGIKIIKENLTLVMLFIVGLSVVPPLIEIFLKKKEIKK